MTNILSSIPEFDGEVASSSPSGSGAIGESLYCNCMLRVALKSEDDVNKWLSLFEKRTKTRWISDHENSGKKCKRRPTNYIVNRNYICHHSNYRKTAGSKKAYGCSATLKIRVKKPSRFVHYRDEYAKRGFYGVITLNNVHSHLIDNAQALRWLKRSDETKETFLAYFNEGRSPADARQLHQNIVMAEDVCKLADSSVNPPERWIYKLHDAWRKKQFGDVTVTSDFLSVARRRIAGLTEEGFRISLQEEPCIISVCSPVMQRALLSDSDSRSFFIDSSASCDQFNTSLTIVMVASKAGAVPVGFSLHNSQDTASYTSVFSQLKTLWGSVSPDFVIENFMTDDSRAMKSALSAVWPHTKQYLCIFHVMQAQWRWLCEGKNGVRKESRKEIMEAFAKVLYAESQQKAAEAMSAILDDNAHDMEVDDESADNDKLSHHMSALWKRKEEWCLSYRISLTRGNNTNNYSEATFRIIKDTILCRLKSYNKLALLDYLVRVLEKYYSVRLLNVAFGRQRKGDVVVERINKLAEPILAMEDGVVQKSTNIYQVRSASSDCVYDVDGELGICSCFVGRQGAYCKHQSAVSTKHGIRFAYCPGICAADKVSLFFLATGQSPPSNFLTNMNDISHFPESSSGSCEMTPTISTTCESVAPSSSCPVVPVEQLEDVDQVWADVENEWLRIKSMIEKNKSDPSLGASARKLLCDLRKISTPANLYDYSTRSPFSLFRRRKIPVQPTSVSRRVEGVSRGSGRARSGRPLAVVAAARRRAIQQRHCLGEAIAANRASSKSHGDGH